MTDKGVLNFKALQRLIDPFEQLHGKKLKLILHAGTPKTGTTSVQHYLGKRQRKLRSKGILYPHNLERADNPTAPQHQWFEKNVVTHHRQYFLENLTNIVSQITQDTHTIILSSEGIYNFWWDFSDESKKMLSELSGLFDTQVWVWFREPDEFIERFYKQCIRNPSIESNECYGKDMSLEAMLDNKWFSSHLDYVGFVSQCTLVFGQSAVKAFKYETDVVQKFSKLLGLATPHDNPTARLNSSLNNGAIALLRTVNQLQLSAKDKQRLMPHIKEINSIIASYQVEPIMNHQTRQRILSMFSYQGLDIGLAAEKPDQ